MGEIATIIIVFVIKNIIKEFSIYEQNNSYR